MAETIQFQSQLPQLIESLMGSKQTTTGTANIDPLQQVFHAAMTAQGASVPEMQNLISAIFKEGAKQIPELTAAYANATGTRTKGNSGLELALGDLNRKMSTDAATAILNNQNANRTIAGNAASAIGADTRAEKTVKKTAVNPLLPIIAGWGLNKAGAKGGIMDKIFGDQKSSGTPSFSADPTRDSNPDFNGSVSDTINAGGNSEVSVATPDVSGMDFSGDAAGDVVADGLNYGPDPSAVDFGSGGTALDFGSGADFGAEDLGDFFANGGPVSKPMRGYADGGALQESGVSLATDGTAVGIPRKRKQNNIGTDNPSIPGGGSGNGVGLAALSASVGGTSSNGSTGVGGTGSTSSANSDGPAVDVPSVVGTPAENNAVVDGFLASLVGAVTGLPIVTPVINAITGGKSLNPISQIGQVIVSQLSTPDGNTAIDNGVNTAPTSTAPTGSVTPGSVAATPDGMPSPADTAMENAINDQIDSSLADDAPTPGLVSDNEAAVAAVTAAISADPSSAVASPDAVGMSAADANAATGDAASDGGTSGDGSAGASGVGGDSAGAGYADGGLITGGDDGIDDITIDNEEPGGSKIKVTGEEYILPPDVVRYWGTRNLDKLKAAIHTPVARGR